MDRLKCWAIRGHLSARGSSKWNRRAALAVAGKTRRLEPPLACILLLQSELEDEGIWSKSQADSSVGRRLLVRCWCCRYARTRSRQRQAAGESETAQGRRPALLLQHRGAVLGALHPPAIRLTMFDFVSTPSARVSSVKQEEANRELSRSLEPDWRR